MRKIIATLILAMLVLSAQARAEEAKDMREALGQCKTYDDYEKVCDELKGMAAGEINKTNVDVTYYMIGKARVDELSYLAKNNDIESGRLYMSVNEKYFNEAQDFLDKAEQATKSKDLALEVYLLKFSIAKEHFQPQKVDAVFNEIINRIASYSDDKAKNLAKLNEISKKISDKGIADYAMKLKFIYASKVDPESAKMLADDIKMSADKYLEAGNIKEALSTYDTYLKLAENYYDKDAMAAKLMDIAEKYFDKKRYKDAIKYYSMYLAKYSASQLADYAAYKEALSYYSDKDYKGAIKRIEEFLKTYQNSVWFEKGFEALCVLYYETSDTQIAMENLQKLIDAYPRRDNRDYAYLLTGILYYSKPDYDKALEVFRKIQQEFSRSAFFNVTDTLISDINEIKKGAAPSYSFGAKDAYRVWEPYTGIGITVSPGEDIKTKSGSKITFALTGVEDLDRFNEFIQDKEDQSRLPRETKTGTEKDLVFFAWSCGDSGKFLDDKQTSARVWQAPDAPGDYIITINAGDMALVRPPDSGSRKDEPKTITIHVTVEK